MKYRSSLFICYFLAWFCVQQATEVRVTFFPNASRDTVQNDEYSRLLHTVLELMGRTEAAMKTLGT